MNVVKQQPEAREIAAEIEAIQEFSEIMKGVPEFKDIPDNVINNKAKRDKLITLYSDLQKLSSNTLKDADYYLENKDKDKNKDTSVNPLVKSLRQGYQKCYIANEKLQKEKKLDKIFQGFASLEKGYLYIEKNEAIDPIKFLSIESKIKILNDLIEEITGREKIELTLPQQNRLKQVELAHLFINSVLDNIKNPKTITGMIGKWIGEFKSDTDWLNHVKKLENNLKDWLKKNDISRLQNEIINNPNKKFNEILVESDNSNIKINSLLPEINSELDSSKQKEELLQQTNRIIQEMRGFHQYGKVNYNLTYTQTARYVAEKALENNFKDARAILETDQNHKKAYEDIQKKVYGIKPEEINVHSQANSNDIFNGLVSLANEGNSLTVAQEITKCLEGETANLVLEKNIRKTSILNFKDGQRAAVVLYEDLDQQEVKSITILNPNDENDIRTLEIKKPNEIISDDLVTAFISALEIKSTPQLRKKVKENMQKEAYEQLANFYVAEHILEDKDFVNSKAKKDIWQQYCQMFDPKDDITITTDHYKDMWKDEITNAPLIIASGGAGSAVKGLLGYSLKKIIGKRIFTKAQFLALQKSINTTYSSAFFGTATRKGLGKHVSESIGKKKLLAYQATTFTGGAINAMVFNEAHNALLTGELILPKAWQNGEIPSYVINVFATQAVFGTFHASGKLGAEISQGISNSIINKAKDKNLVYFLTKNALSPGIHAGAQLSSMTIVMLLLECAANGKDVELADALIHSFASSLSLMSYGHILSFGKMKSNMSEEINLQRKLLNENKKTLNKKGEITFKNKKEAENALHILELSGAEGLKIESRKAEKADVFALSTKLFEQYQIYQESFSNSERLKDLNFSSKEEANHFIELLDIKNTLKKPLEIIDKGDGNFGLQVKEGKSEREGGRLSDIMDKLKRKKKVVEITPENVEKQFKNLSQAAEKNLIQGSYLKIVTEYGRILFLNAKSIKINEDGKLIISFKESISENSLENFEIYFQRDQSKMIIYNETKEGMMSEEIKSFEISTEKEVKKLQDNRLIKQDPINKSYEFPNAIKTEESYNLLIGSLNSLDYFNKIIVYDSNGNSKFYDIKNYNPNKNQFITNDGQTFTIQKNESQFPVIRHKKIARKKDKPFEVSRVYAIKNKIITETYMRIKKLENSHNIEIKIPEMEESYSLQQNELILGETNYQKAYKDVFDYLEKDFKPKDLKGLKIVLLNNRFGEKYTPAEGEQPSIIIDIAAENNIQKQIKDQLKIIRFRKSIKAYDLLLSHYPSVKAYWKKTSNKKLEENCQFIKKTLDKFKKQNSSIDLNDYRLDVNINITGEAKVETFEECPPVLEISLFKNQNTRKSEAEIIQEIKSKIPEMKLNEKPTSKIHFRELEENLKIISKTNIDQFGNPKISQKNTNQYFEITTAEGQVCMYQFAEKKQNNLSVETFFLQEVNLSDGSIKEKIPFQILRGSDNPFLVNMQNKKKIPVYMSKLINKAEIVHETRNIYPANLKSNQTITIDGKYFLESTGEGINTKTYAYEIVNGEIKVGTRGEKVETIYYIDEIGKIINLSSKLIKIDEHMPIEINNDGTLKYYLSTHNLHEGKICINRSEAEKVVKKITFPTKSTHTDAAGNESEIQLGDPIYKIVKDYSSGSSHLVEGIITKIGLDGNAINHSGIDHMTFLSICYKEGSKAKAEAEVQRRNRELIQEASNQRE